VGKLWPIKVIVNLKFSIKSEIPQFVPRDLNYTEDYKLCIHFNEDIRSTVLLR